jgi:hypothetical protein
MTAVIALLSACCSSSSDVSVWCVCDDFVLSQGGDKVTGNYSAEVGELSYCVTTPVSLS